MANRLAQETSPYLLQHAGNPVDWYAWSPEALETAKREDKPIFLSVGYSACHWCHVMAHESFEDPEVARLLNESFISIKVDREERPEVDQILGRFTDAEQGGFFAAPADHGSLIVRKKDMIDSSVPSGGGLATLASLAGGTPSAMAAGGE